MTSSERIETIVELVAEEFGAFILIVRLADGRISVLSSFQKDAKDELRNAAHEMVDMALSHKASS